MEQFPPIQDHAQKQPQAMQYNQYEEQHYPMQQSGATSFSTNPLYTAQYNLQNTHLEPQPQTYPREAWKALDTQPIFSQQNSHTQSYQPYLYHQTMDYSQPFSPQNMNQEYSNLRAVADSPPHYESFSPRKRQRFTESNRLTPQYPMPTKIQSVEIDTTSECCSSCPSGSLCAEPDCGENNVVIACTSPECEQPVCTSPECEEPIFAELCAKDGGLHRRSLVAGDNATSNGPTFDNHHVALHTQQQFSTFLRNVQPSHEMSPSPVPTTPSLAPHMDTPYSDTRVSQTPGLATQELPNNMSGSSLSGAGMRFDDGLDMFSCNWLDCGQPMHDQQEWHKHFHQEHIDPQFTFNCPMSSGSCQAPLNSNPLDHLQMNHGFTFDQNTNGFHCPAPGCLTDEMYCDPSMLHNHMDQMHAIPLQGQLHCQIESCNTSFQDPNQFFSHLNHDHSLPIPMTPVEEIDLSGISMTAKQGTEEEAEEEVEDGLVEDVSHPEKNEAPESINHLSCKWTTGNSHCGRIFTSETDLQTHVKEVHLSILNKTSGYFCKWQGCSRKHKMGDKEGFSQRGKLERHMASHTGFKECTCTFPGCGKTFAAAQSLKQHYRLHTGEKPWKCRYCDKAFPQQSACTVHERIHTQEKPLVCGICGKTFSESSNLAKHRKTHGERGSYECRECPKTFHRLDQLKRHGEMHERRRKKGADGEGGDGKSEVAESVATESMADEASARGAGEN